MLSGEFARKLRALNRELRIWCADNDHLPAGLFRVQHGEYEQICSVDKQWVPEHTMFDAQGFIKKSGWRRVLGILIRQRLVDRRHAERLFGAHLPVAMRNRSEIPTWKPKHKLMDKYVERYLTPEEATKMVQKGK